MAWLRPLIGLLVFALAWEWFASGNHVLAPPLASIFREFLHQATAGALFEDTAASTLRVIAGVLISVLIAWPLGVISAYCKSLPRYLGGVVELLRPVPPIAWTPIAIIAFGIGDRPAIAIVAVGAFFPIWFGVIQGLSEVKQAHLRAAWSLGCGKWLLLTDVIVPSSFPYLVHGLRLGVGLGWFCVVAAEMIGASSGLGYGVHLYSLNLELERLYVYLLAIGAVGYLSNLLLRWADLRVGSVYGR